MQSKRRQLFIDEPSFWKSKARNVPIAFLQIHSLQSRFFAQSEKQKDSKPDDVSIAKHDLHLYASKSILFFGTRIASSAVSLCKEGYNLYHDQVAPEENIGSSKARILS